MTLSKDASAIAENRAPLPADVLVVGGGPAGTWAAIKAAQAGADVVLVDKGRCGSSGSAGSVGTPGLSSGSWDSLMAAAGEEPRAEVTAAEFRHAIGHFATGVTIVTAIGADGEPVGTTANAVTSLSLDPPLLLVCFDRSSVTLRAVRHHGAFVVNVLAAPQRHLSANFARRGLTATWDDVRHHAGLTGSPRLDGVLAAIECTVEERLPGGDHEIIVGRVQDVETNGKNAAPLLFWRGGYGSLVGAAGPGQ